MKYKIIVLALFFMFIFSDTLFASQPTNEILKKELDIHNNDIAAAIISMLQNGTDAEDVVNTAISMGFSAYTVINSALRNGADLNGVLMGACKAGVSPDVMSKASLDSGANAVEIANLIDACYAGQGYLFSGVKGHRSLSINLPEGGGGHNYISPSDFRH